MSKTQQHRVSRKPNGKRRHKTSLTPTQRAARARKRKRKAEANRIVPANRPGRQRPERIPAELKRMADDMGVTLPEFGGKA